VRKRIAHVAFPSEAWVKNLSPCTRKNSPRAKNARISVVGAESGAQTAIAVVRTGSSTPINWSTCAELKRPSHASSQPAAHRQLKPGLCHNGPSGRVPCAGTTVLWARVDSVRILPATMRVYAHAAGCRWNSHHQPACAAWPRRTATGHLVDPGSQVVLPRLPGPTPLQETAGVMRLKTGS